MSSALEDRLRASSSQPKEVADSRQIALLAAQKLAAKKGEAVLMLDLRRFDIGCDFFVLATGKSDIHVRALTEAVEEALEEAHGLRPWHVEGTPGARWVLMDYVDIVVHIFQREAREFYMLERLWGDAPSELIESEDGGLSDEDDDSFEQD